MEKYVDEIKKILDEMLIFYNNSKNENKNIPVFDPIKSEVTIKNNTIKLSRGEYIVFKELLLAPEHFCSHERLCNKLYGCSYEKYAAKSLNKIVRQLRRKFNGLINVYNVFGRGYKMDL